ncbi:MFS transporter [Arthrobacter sp. NPDC090010]|uniref:MFS transporter n=1 Tax=Arthrobacter sp. NPDC090010 TaxID=3363942 RepID=UPI0038162C6D
MVEISSLVVTSAGRVRIRMLMVALLAACVAFQLNASMLSPALVVMAKELNTDEASIGLTQTAFFTSTALFGLFLPRWSDIRGRKLVMILMLGGMTLGAVLAAVAPNLQVLFVARAMQGVSGSIVSISLMMLRSEVNDRRRYGVLLGVITSVNGGIAGLDALLGGFLAMHFGFRSIFWVIAVVGVAAAALVLSFSDESRPSAGVQMDWWGTVPLILAVLFLQSAVNEAGAGPAAGWGRVGGFLLAAVLAAGVFWVVESRTREPLASTLLLRRRATWAMFLTTMLTMAGIFATVNGLVMSLAQNPTEGFGLSADTASLLLLTPYAIAGWLVGPLAGRIAPRIGYRTVLRWGLFASIVISIVLGLVGVGSLPVLVICTCLLGVFYAGMVNIMLNGLGVVLSPPANPGFLPGLNASAFGLGAGLSFAILPAVQLMTGSYTGGILAGAAITVASLLVSWLIPKPENAELEQ